MEGEPVDFVSIRSRKDLQQRWEEEAAAAPGTAPTEESKAQYARLFALAEKQTADMLARPMLYIEKAAREIARLQRVLDAARDALRAGSIASYTNLSERPILDQIETLRVTKREYDRLMGCAQVVRKYFEDRDKR